MCGDIQILRDFPYLLPNLVTSLFAGIGLVLVYFFLPETLAVKGADQSRGEDTADTEKNMTSTLSEAGVSGLDSDRRNEETTEQTGETTSSSGATVKELMATHGVLSGVSAYFTLSFVSIIYDEVLPLWAMATHDRGGLNIEQLRIGQILSLVGFVLLLYTFFCYPFIQGRLGNVLGFRFGQFLFFPFVLLTTTLNMIPVNSSWLIPVTVIVVAATKMCAFLAFSSISLFLNETVPSEKRASLNGFSMSIGSLAKFLGIFVGSILFAWSINNDLVFPLDSHFVFITVAVLSIISAYIPLNIKLVEERKDGNENSDIAFIELTAHSKHEDPKFEQSVKRTIDNDADEYPRIPAVSKPRILFHQSASQSYSRLPSEE